MSLKLIKINFKSFCFNFNELTEATGTEAVDDDVDSEAVEDDVDSEVEDDGVDSEVEEDDVSEVDGVVNGESVTFE